MGTLWESAKTIYTYVEQSGISVEDLDIQVHVYTFPMTKDFLTYCKENDYTFHATKGSGDDVDILMSYPHYDFTYTDIDSLEWVTNCTEETKFSVGTCASAGFNFSIFSEKYLDDGTEVNYEDISFKAAVVIPVYDFSYGDTLIAQKQLGIFHVTEYEKEAGMINFTCLDNMRFLDKKATKIANFITVPLKSDVLMANILTKVNLRMGAIPGVKYFQVNKVDHLKKLTFRTIFGYATEPIGAFAYANYIGNICAKCFNVSDAATVTIPYDNIIDDKNSGAGVKINGFEIQYGDNMVSGFLYDEGEEEIEVPVPLTVDNPLFIKKKQDSLEIIGNRLDSRMNGFTFEPYEVTTFLPNFYIEAGDFVNVEDKNGVMHKILVSQLTWRDNLEMEIVSACETEGDESSSYDSDVNEAIQRNENIDDEALDSDVESDEPTTVEMIYTGQEFNAAVKYLTTGYKDVYTVDETIETIEVTHTAPASDAESYTLADTSSEFQLEMYVDGTILKLYTDAEQIILPADSSYMFYLFHNLKNLNMQSNEFDASKVENMYYMFAECGYGGQLEEVILNFNTSNVSNMSYMFKQFGYNLNNTVSVLTLGENFDTSKVTNMNNMFSLAYIKDVELGSGFDTSNVTDMASMFSSCYTNSIELGNKFNTSNVTDMSSMFKNCGKEILTSLALPDSFDTSNVTNMSDMFRGCGYNSLTELKLGSNFNTSKVTNMSGMFRECGYKTLYSVDLGAKFLANENLNSITYMFYYFGKSKTSTGSIIYLPASFLSYLKEKGGDSYASTIGITEEQLAATEYE